MASTVPAVLPPDLQQLVDEFLAIEQHVDALLDRLDDEQFNWAPSPGAWSIGQCIDHLNRAAATYLARLEPAVAEAQSARRRRQHPIRCTWFGRAFVARLEPPVRARMRAPRTIVPSRHRLLKVDVWPEFVRLHGHVRALIHRSADVDLNAARFRNPFVPLVVMRAGTALRVLAAHDRRHLWQAANIRATPGFPRG